MGLTELARIVGPNIALRLVQPDDAEYVYSLRANPIYSRYLSKVHGSVEDQRQWITSYKSREQDLRELYYVIERHNGVPCGVVRLYEIDGGSFTWGSWILDGNKTYKAALESAFLVYSVAFDILGLLRAHFKVDRENQATLSFHRSFGATETHASPTDIHFAYTRDQYKADAQRFARLLAGA